MGGAPRLLHSGFLRSSDSYPDRVALEAAGETLTYAELREGAARIAATLMANETGGPPLSAVFAHRTPTAFAGLLGTLMGGNGYVPLNRMLPPMRTRTMLERSGARTIVADGASAELLPEVLAGLEPGFLVVLPDLDDGSRLAPQLEGHRVVCGPGLTDAGQWTPPAGEEDAIAYILFTSGSTGVPKGVMVAHRNVFNYLDFLSERYEIGPDDRLSNSHDLTFDPSVKDIFLAWEHGARVCCPASEALIRPGPFIRDSRLTLWAAVPSTAVFMRRFGMLAPGAYPELRRVLCAGEPLPVETAAAYLEAAPNATLDNLYGPTELTIDCTIHRFDPATTPGQAEHGVVPIGTPIPNMTPLFAGPDLREVAPGEKGELLMTGPQVTLGYWRDPERTAAAFVVPPGHNDTYYRTGDLVRRPAAEGGPITYLGRIDHQVKVRGVRIELGEVEAALREVTGADAAVALGWPKTARGVDGIVAFVGQESLDAEAALAALGERLAPQMVPRRIVALAELPLNANGKYDRGALAALLESGAA